jgi:hypothetical protein
MKFIHFGCWNKGNCDISNPGSQPVSAVMASIKKYIENEEDKPTFITVAGDNYYPDNKGKIKTQNYDNFKSGFDCLVNLGDIHKYIIFGNHDYDDVYVNNRAFINNPNFKQTDISCVNVKSQLELLNNNSNFTVFNNVLHNFEASTKKLVIMIDSNIYVNTPKIHCYKYVFNEGGENKEKTIEEIRNLQLGQVRDIISSCAPEEIIFIGHQPIIYCRTRSDNHIQYLENFITFFNNLKSVINDIPIKYFCADIHFFQQGTIELLEHGLKIEQYIIGTGGTYHCDKICKLDKLVNDPIRMNDLISYKITDQKQEYGYLIYDNGNVEFKEVPFKTASYTIIDGDIKIFDKNFNNDDQVVCSQIGSGYKRKYKINYI